MVLVGVAGPSGSGKSTLARALAQCLPDHCVLISLDSYYNDLSNMTKKARQAYNFDAPEALEKGRLVADLSALAAGEAVDVPVYRFDDHVRASKPQHVAPAPFVVVEGLYALYWEAVRDLLHLKVYVDVPDGVCLERRLARDTRERGRSAASVRRQYAATVRPMFERHVAPTQSLADLVVDGRRPVADSCAAILTALGTSGT